MPSYVVLARKWRPAQFSDIIGQSHIVRTLNNAIRSQRVHQAYLFTGSRGIGKTSIARILAKVLRCENLQDENGITKSCDSCSNCKEIAASNSVDVIEIDGASNNGVEAVREIRENAKYMPSTGSRKIYIIDEVHMLTTAAFNALLKILEEPPSHVLFVFATTEPHKIPATILSRCQRFDYRKVTLSQIQARLAEILASEGIQVESGALSLISRAAEGSMRDALSLLDQVIAFSGSQISLQSVRESIGLIEGQTLLGILEGVFQREPLKALQHVEQAYQQGYDLRILTRSLIEFLHAALLAKIGANHPIEIAAQAVAEAKAEKFDGSKKPSLPLEASQEISETEWKELQQISSLRTIEEIELFFQILHQGLEWIARSSQPKIVLDVLLIKCATAEALIYVNSAVSGNQAIPNRIEKPSQPLLPKPEIKATTSSIEPITAKIETSAPTSVTEAPRENQKKPLLSWEGFIGHVRQSRPLLASILEHSSATQLPSQEGDKIITLCFAPQEAYFREQLHARVYQEQLAYLSKEYLGYPAQWKVEIKNAGESLAAKKEREHKERIELIKEKAQKHPVLLEAQSLFGGEMSPIEIRPEIKEASSHADLSI